jgi:hypothetical protein
MPALPAHAAIFLAQGHFHFSTSLPRVIFPFGEKVNFA